MQTIFAPATPAARSGVTILRISGPSAKEVFSVLRLTPPTPRLATLTTLRHPKTQEVIDRTIMLWFPAPASFTGEDTIEFHLHGSRAIIDEMMEILSEIPDFKIADPGEFSRQAFYNNKMDLAQTEGLADLIDAQTTMQKRQALRQMQGELSTFCNDLRTEIIEVRAHLEAYLDFPDEEIPSSVAEELDNEIKTIYDKINTLLKRSGSGEKIREGFYGIILGAPNAGKSTLLNTLAKRDIAITSNIAGTTRDVLEAHLNIEGYPLTLADTAGIRENAETIEAEGIRRAKEKAEHADFRIIVLDVTQSEKNQLEILSLIQPEDIIILNKTDTKPQDIVFSTIFKESIPLSAKEQKNIESLILTLKTRMDRLISSQSDISITRSRHRIAYKEAATFLDNALKQSAIELKGEELRMTSQSLSKIIGTIELDDILDVVFSSFCIGK